MAAITTEMVTAGPAASAEAEAVRTNKPAPIIAPIHKANREPAPKVFLRPFSLAATNNFSIDFFLNTDIEF